mgnify:CR=1 FL=1
MYYVKDNHVAIIDRDTFNKAQEELALRINVKAQSKKNSVTGQGKYSKYALSDVLRCGECGTKYRRVTWSKKGNKKMFKKVYVKNIGTGEITRVSLNKALELVNRNEYRKASERYEMLTKEQVLNQGIEELIKEI